MSENKNKTDQKDQTKEPPVAPELDGPEEENEDINPLDLWEEQLDGKYWAGIEYGLRLALLAFCGKRDISLSNGVNKDAAAEFMQLLTCEWDPNTDDWFPYQDSLEEPLVEETLLNREIIEDLWGAGEAFSVMKVGKFIGLIVGSKFLEAHHMETMHFIEQLKCHSLSEMEVPLGHQKNE